ncbi:MAG: aminotransferase class V-fold PLP-dependent enzyme, partial [Candidatus Baltobacteraceae bacterium]
MTKELLLIPGPVNVGAAVLAAAGRPMIDHRGPAFATLLGRIGEALRPLFGTSSDVVLLGGSGTAGLDAAIASQFGPGDRLVAAPVGVFGRRLVAIARTYGCEVEVLETPAGAALDPDVLRERLAADRDGRIAGVLLTQNETSTGVQNDVEALSRAIGEHPAIVVVDAVSGLGASRFAMDDWRFDVVVGASQKVLAAPPGLAMLALSARSWKRAEAPRAPRFSLDLARARDFARLGQTPWTPPVSIVFALDAALEAFACEGAPNVWRRH